MSRCAPNEEDAHPDTPSTHPRPPLGLAPTNRHLCRQRRLIVAVLAVAAVGAAAQGLWIPAKAAVAQLLLHHSWQEKLRGQTTPPWPWADIAPVARLRLPRLRVDQLVLAGASGAALAFGPGLVTGERFRSNTVVAGHRDTHFRFLRHIAIGDRIIVDSADGTQHTYAVHWTRVVAEDATWVAHATPDDSLTLITCYPFDGIAGQADQRFVVRARRVADREETRLARHPPR